LHGTTLSILKLGFEASSTWPVYDLVTLRPPPLGSEALTVSWILARLTFSPATLPRLTG
jgi:hypothetical protein